MVETLGVSAKSSPKIADQTTFAKDVLLKVFEIDQSLGMWMKLSMLSRKTFLAFKHYSKDGKVKHLRHEDHGKYVEDHLVRRICARRIGKNLDTLSFQFSAVTDDHIEKAVLP